MKKQKWTPGSRIGCNHGSNNPGHKKGEALPRRLSLPGARKKPNPQHRKELTQKYLEESLARISPRSGDLTRSAHKAQRDAAKGGGK